MRNMFRRRGQRLRCVGHDSSIYGILVSWTWTEDRGEGGGATNLDTVGGGVSAVMVELESECE